MQQVSRILKPSGAFWLAIGDEFVAELKVIATQDLGLYCRNWVVWYYTFGVHCTGKFGRSHTHLLYFAKDPRQTVFNDHAIRVPSARQLVYADKRANPTGRIPDATWIIRPAASDSWILRPQDLADGFAADSDCWYFPRVCGTFKERAGFHGCQMPEQLLGRIVRTCSNEKDLVVDPFAGSGTTLVVAKKLGRQYLGFELSRSYAVQASKRLQSAAVGEALHGSEYPLASAPPTDIRPASAQKGKIFRKPDRARIPAISRHPGIEKEGIKKAFLASHKGYSPDRLIADPELNVGFIDRCRIMGIRGGPRDWNLALFGLRKAGLLAGVKTTKRDLINPQSVAACEFASEIAIGCLCDEDRHNTLDSVLCDPDLVRRFDEFAKRIVPGYETVHYRWAALRLRKRAKAMKDHASMVGPLLVKKRFRDFAEIKENSPQRGLDPMPGTPGLYLIDAPKKRKALYVGGCSNLGKWMAGLGPNFFSDICQWSGSKSFSIKTLELDSDFKADSRLGGARSWAISRHRPLWNLSALTDRLS